MILIHKYFKLHTLVSFSFSNYLFVSSSCVFISAKVNYSPVSLEMIVQAIFTIEKRLNPSQMMRTSLSKDREKYYRDMVEKAEFEILVATGFDLEFELPYKHLRSFCDKHVAYATREIMFQLSLRFCNDSFNLPLCLFFHPKVIAAACLQMAVKFRINGKCDPGFQSKI